MGYPPPHVIYIRQGTTLEQIPVPTKNVRPAFQGLFNVPANDWAWTFGSWQNEGSDWTLTAPVQQNMNFAARWNSPYGPRAIPSELSPPEFPFETTCFINRAFYYMSENPGDYYLFLSEDHRVSANGFDLLPFSGGGAAAGTGTAFTVNAGAILRNSTVTLIGVNEMRTITRGGLNGVLFAVTGNAEMILGENITLSGNLNLPSNAGLLLLYGPAGTVASNANLVMLEGSKITRSHLTVAAALLNAPVLVRGPNASFTMYGGAISGNTSANVNIQNTGGVRVSHGATFTMEGGEIHNNTLTGVIGVAGNAIATAATGGVFVYGTSANPPTGTTFNMNGGRIHSNIVYGGSSAGGVAQVVGTTFNMNGGEISNNTIRILDNEHSINSNTGGGVRTIGNLAQFNMNGGRISGNIVHGENSGGGVMIQGLVTVNINSGDISGNTAHGNLSGGGVGMNGNGHLNIRGGAIFANTAHGENSGGGLHVHISTLTGTPGHARIVSGTIYGSNAPAGRANTAAETTSGAALRATLGALHFGVWNNADEWVRNGSFTTTAPRAHVEGDTAGSGIYDNTIRAVNGVLQ